MSIRQRKVMCRCPRLLHAVTILLAMIMSTTAQTSTLLNTASILMKLYQKTGGSQWKNSNKWNDDPYKVCSWYGIECWPSDESMTEIRGQVKAINLSDNKLVGKVPSDIWGIPYLQSVILRDNPDMDLDLTNVWNAHWLEYLVLSNTGIADLSNIEYAEWLVELYLTECSLGGALPAGIFKLKYLQGLYANYNRFESNIPSQIGQLTALTELYLYNNDFTGNIPSEIGLLTNLQVLVLSDNYMSGGIPDAVNKLVNLRVLALQKDPTSRSTSGFTGTLSSLSTLFSLTELYLSHNSLTGSIPRDFLASAPQDKLVTVDLSYNEISGTVPGYNSLSRFGYLNIYLIGNKISAVDDTICESSDSWMDGAVGKYGCYAILCPAYYCAPDGRQTIDEEKCTPCNWPFYGGTTTGPVTQKDILNKFYIAAEGHSWIFREGNETAWGSDPNECVWQGIACNEDGDITEIDLSNRNLVGYVQAEIFSLPYLKILNLGDNYIEFDFDGIENAKRLEYLYLYSCGLKELKNFDQVTKVPLKELYLTANDLDMEIPSEIYQISTLEYLSLSYNKFHGTISKNIQKLQKLKYFYAYSNELTGTIPSEIGQLQETLIELVLSENDFTGTIPQTFNDMWELKYLSIHQTTNSRGGLTGKLPTFSSCDNLDTIHLSSNSLSGTLPTDLLEFSRVLSASIEIDLSRNQFSGRVPSDWTRFLQLNVDLTNNKITSIGSSLCSKSNWQDDEVMKYGCDSILCPIGYYNEYGRASSSAACRVCSLAQFMGTTTCGEANEQRDILTELYYSLGGEKWTRNDYWLSDTNECTWSGIECDSDGKVSRIDLTGIEAYGTPATSLFRLPSLTEISLSNNQIKFDFEGIQDAEYLETLYLAETNIDSLQGISYAASLRTLHVTGSALSGTIPDELFDMVQLENLYMSYNSFTGRIPSRIGELTRLKDLYLLQNELEGQIPASIGFLTNLQNLVLGENLLRGTLPEELQSLTNLVTLSIGGRPGNNGTGLSGPLLSFRLLANLEGLYLYDNLLTGTIPDNFLDELDSEAKLLVDLKGNRLEGRVPSSLIKFTSLDIDLTGNQLTDLPESFCSRGDWMSGRVQTYGCNAIMCPPTTFAVYGYQYDNNSTCQQCPTSLYANFWGSLKCLTQQELDAENEVPILIDIFKNLNGRSWDDNSGWLDYSVGVCNWKGISCSTEMRVEGINLPYNGLDGTVPSGLFNLEKLKYINLSGNYITINLKDIGKLRNLVTLNLEDTGLASIEGIESASQLVSLYVGYNQFSSFPMGVSSLYQLQSLSMSNSPFSMPIPSHLKNLSRLSFFTCNQCGFYGSVPSFIGSMTNITYLSLANNKLSGTIPSEVANLPKLQYINLSGQVARGGGITGTIPIFRSSALSNVYLSRNKLSGTIPENFLSVASNITVQIDLRQNSIQGEVPAAFTKYTDLTILLGGNRVEIIPTALCSMNWNNGDVRAYQCDGLLCPPGTFNALGRKSQGKSEGCQTCASAVYFGSMACGDAQSQEVALLKFYFDLRGDSWVRNDNWVQSDNICLWYGIDCDTVGNVISIKLESNGLRGEVPMDIFDIITLTEISLKGNDISFSFNGISKLTKLEKLVLSATGLPDIQGVGMATALKYLYLTSNTIVSLPSEIYDLTNLKELLLNYNGISGTLSSRIGMLSNLENLFLFHNKISGSIPSEIGFLSKLTMLALGENFLTGPIPDELNSMKNLEVLALERQGLGRGRILSSSVTGFSSTVPSLHLNPKLREVYLGENNIAGPIPNNFLAGLDDFDVPVTVDLSGNKITGSLPLSLLEFSVFDLNIAGNRIDEIDDAFCYLSNWMGGLVGDYGCDAISCPIGTFNSYGRQTSDEGRCLPCPYKSSVAVYGSTACITSGTSYSEKEILSQLYSSTGGSKWTDSKNWLSDNVHFCEWYGVICKSNKLIELDLTSNNLVGTVPSEIYGLIDMSVLKLNDNKVDISFVGIGNALLLEALYLDKTLISSLRGLDQALGLRILHVQSNNFRGSWLPADLFDIVSLEELHVADSHFSGKIPDLIGSLVNLKELLCHANDFTGTIPSAIGKLKKLEVLSLSENKLFGTIPKEIGNLQLLQSLFIDHYTKPGAGLSGPLPSFSDMNAIREIYLGGNSLTGTIPHTFLSGVDNTSIRINVGLKSNRLTGTIPAELSRFDKLNLDLTDNWITGIDKSLCEKENWMDGAVGIYGCSAILCPRATFNINGRESTSGSSCKPCSSDGDVNSIYLGATVCLSYVKKQERDVLVKFYNSCGGKKWTKSDHWLDKNTDICKWYGISCHEGGTIKAILLGSNNLSGSPPKELFQLANLEWLWLYSNSINFSFEGIENAGQLQSLLLDSTGLKSLKGISAATQLKELDARFNSLVGPFPSELLQLVNLEILALSHNQFTGNIPSLDTLPVLQSLRLEHNHFTGKIQSFSALVYLKTVDLSSNRLTGSIPQDILENSSAQETIFIDLSDNLLTGTVPGEIAKFYQATVYLRDNFISSIDTPLCDMYLWNGGDLETFSCSGLLCPPGTYAQEKGRASKSGSQCVSCNEAKYYGQSQCVDLKAMKSTVSDSSEGNRSRVMRGVLIGLGMIISGIIILYAFYRYRTGKEY